MAKNKNTRAEGVFVLNRRSLGVFSILTMGTAQVKSIK
jgi:hypothetical protein